MTVIVPQHAGNDCPTANEWRDALQGRIAGGRWSAIEEHLLQCSRCELTVDALTEQSDTFVRELCRRPSTADDEPAFRALYANLLNAAGFAFARHGSDADEIRSKLPFQLGNYELLSHLGHGANGSVFKARHVPLDRVVAIKLLRPDHDFDPSRVDRFMQEIRAVGRLNHPHLVRATDAGQTEGRHFLAMEYVPGIDLSTLVTRCGPLRPCDACEIIRQAALGLAYLHENGFVHRDLKPSNVLLTAEAQIKLLDLGLVQFVGHDGTLQNGHRKWPDGTPDYMPPEQWLDFQQVDMRSDIYSLGCTLFKLLTGAPPYRPLPEDYQDRCAAHCRAPIPSLGAIRPDVPAALQVISERLLAKRAVDRFSTATEMSRKLQPLARGADLRALARATGLKPMATAASPPRSRFKFSSLSRRQALLAATVVLGGAATGLLGLRRRASLMGPQIRANTWRDLTPASPAVLLAAGDDGEGSWAQNAEGHFVLQAPAHLLLNLGQPLVGNFRLAVEMTQRNWHGRAGLFFGFHQDREEYGALPSFQTLELIRGRDGKLHEFRLLWSGFRLQDHDRCWDEQRKLWADIRVPPPTAEATVSLEVQLGVAGFPRVSWCGRDLPEGGWRISAEGKFQAAVSEEHLARQFLGHIGLISAGGETVFQRPRLAYLRTGRERNMRREES